MSMTSYREVLRHLEFASQHLQGQRQQSLRSRGWTMGQLARKLKKAAPP